jgi:hypothetical protein
MAKLERFWLPYLFRHWQPYTILAILFNQAWPTLDDFGLPVKSGMVNLRRFWLACLIRHRHPETIRHGQR